MKNKIILLIIVLLNSCLVCAESKFNSDSIKKYINNYEFDSYINYNYQNKDIIKVLKLHKDVVYNYLLNDLITSNDTMQILNSTELLINICDFDEFKTNILGLNNIDSNRKAII